MPFSMVHAQGKQVLKLEGAVTIRSVRELAGMVGECLPARTPVAIETAHLEDIDTCVLQFLCALKKTVPELSFDRPSAIFLGALDRVGLRCELLGMREDA